MSTDTVQATLSDIPLAFSGILQKYHDRVLLDATVSDFDAVLLSVYLIENHNKKTGAEYEDAKRLFMHLGRKEQNFKANIHFAKQKSSITTTDNTINLTTEGLKRIRQKLGQIEKSPVYIIKSGEGFTAVKLLEEFLINEISSPDLMICDPYVSSVTLFPLSTLKDRVNQIRILTTNIHDSSKFKDYEKRFTKELGITLEVRTSSKIHDRYLISGGKCWSIGTSIKDIGNKDTLIREISEVTESMKTLFKERWNEAQPS